MARGSLGRAGGRALGPRSGDQGRFAGAMSNCAAMPRDHQPSFQRALLPLRFFVGGTFLFAGIDKLLDPAFLRVDRPGLDRRAAGDVQPDLAAGAAGAGRGAARAAPGRGADREPRDRGRPGRPDRPRLPLERGDRRAARRDLLPDRVVGRSARTTSARTCPTWSAGSPWPWPATAGCTWWATPIERAFSLAPSPATPGRPATDRTRRGLLQLVVLAAGSLSVAGIAGTLSALGPAFGSEPAPPAGPTRARRCQPHRAGPGPARRTA